MQLNITDEQLKQLMKDPEFKAALVKSVTERTMKYYNKDALVKIIEKRVLNSKLIEELSEEIVNSTNIKKRMEGCVSEKINQRLKEVIGSKFSYIMAEILKTKEAANG